MVTDSRSMRAMTMSIGHGGITGADIVGRRDRLSFEQGPASGAPPHGIRRPYRDILVSRENSGAGKDCVSRADDSAVPHG